MTDQSTEPKRSHPFSSNEYHAEDLPLALYLPLIITTTTCSFFGMGAFLRPFETFASVAYVQPLPCPDFTVFDPNTDTLCFALEACFRFIGVVLFFWGLTGLSSVFLHPYGPRWWIAFFQNCMWVSALLLWCSRQPDVLTKPAFIVYALVQVWFVYGVTLGQIKKFRLQNAEKKARDEKFAAMRAQKKQ